MLSITELVGMLAHENHLPVSLGDMDEAIAQGVIKSAKWAIKTKSLWHPTWLVLAVHHVIQDELICVGDGKAKKDRNKVGSI